MNSVSAKTIQEALVYKQLYNLSEKDNSLAFPSTPTMDDYLQTAERMILLSQDINRTEEERETLVGCTYEYLKKIYKDMKDENDIIRYNRLLSQSFLLILKKPTTDTNIDTIHQEITEKSEWYQFFINNHLHYSIHRQRLSYFPDQENMVAGINWNENWIPWDALEKRVEGQNLHFYRDGTLLFSTDLKYRLKNHFWAGDQGITAGSPIDVEGLGNFFHRPATGKFWLSVYTVAKGETEVRFGTSHSYLSLENSKGKLSYAGQYGLANDVSLSDALTPFGVKQVGIETPDRYSSVPVGQNLIKEMRIEITQEQYQILKESILEDKRKGRKGSMIHGNCTSYVKKKLRLIGLKAKVNMTALEFFLRLAISPLPRQLNKQIVQFFGALPNAIQKIAYFCPIIYFPLLTVTLGARLLSGTKSSISIVDAVVRPWNVTIDHPIVLFENMDELQAQANKFRLYDTKVSDSSDIGSKIQHIYNRVGFDREEEALLKIKLPKHATQYNAGSLIWMSLKAIYKAIENKINNLFSKNTILDHNTMILYLNGLKTQKIITPYEFHELKRNIDDTSLLRQELKHIRQKLYKNKKIDRRSLIHFNDLLKQGKANEALCYLFSIQLFIQMNTDQYKNALKEIISVEMQGQLQLALEYYHNHFTFTTDHIIKIQSLVSRVKCYEWTETIQDLETRNELKKAIKSKNEQDFIDITQHYFEKLAQKSSSMPEKRILEELSQSLQNHLAQNVFVGFAHTMQTQQMIIELEEDLVLLQETVENNIHQMNEQQIQDLRKLHQNIGIFLSNEVAFTGSHTWISAHLGKIRATWQHLEDLLIAKNSAYRIIPVNSERETWPDVGFREIQAIASSQSTEQNIQPTIPKKKVFIAYCTWGNGHKATAEAYTKCLSDTYRVSSCDLPDEVLIAKDPLFKLLGKHNSITTLYNTLVAGNYWRVLGLLRKMGEGPTPAAEFELQKDMIRQKILQERPDILISTYEMHSKHLLELSKELGIPFLQVSTDMVSKFEVFEQADNTYPHFKVAIPFGLPEAKEAISQKIQPEQVAVTGYLIRPEFLTDLDKTSLKEKYQIAENEKVILCMNGGCGGNVPWPQMMAKAKKDTFGKCKMFVVCGKNEAFFNEVKAYQPSDPNIEIIPLGWTNGETLAELNTLADVVITKPGGASTAESLHKKAFMLLDTRLSKELPWELKTAQLIEQYGHGIQLSNEQDFYTQLQSAFGKSLEKRESLPETKSNPLEETKNLIAKMLEDVEADHTAKTLQTQTTTLQQMHGEMPIIESENATFNQNLAELLKFNESLFPKDVLPSLERALWKATKDKCYIRFNFQTNAFETSPTFNKDQFVYVLLLLNRLSTEKSGLSFEILKNLKAILDQHKLHSKENLDLLEKQLCDLDRSRVAKMLRERELTPPNTLEEAQQLYLFDGVKKQLQNWVNLKTSKGRFKKTDESIFKDQMEALKAFVYHPEEYDFIQRLYLHRKVSAFNHQFEIENGSISLLVNGKMTPVSEMMKTFNYVNDRIINREDQREFTYTYYLGLCPIDATNDPFDWQDTIPLFRRKERKHKDYRLEVMTTIGKQNHGWIRLKDPEGNIYSLGRLWDRDYQLEQYKRFKTIPGYVRAGDIQEFTGEEASWKRTKIIISESHFKKIKARVIDIQQNDKNYNLINQNCFSFVEEIFKVIGMNYKVSEHALFLFAFPRGVRKFLIQHRTIGKIARGVVYPLTLLKNSILASFGMYERKEGCSTEQGGFTAAFDIFRTQKSMIAHPSQLRLIQEVMEEELGNKKDDMKILWRQLQDDQRDS